MKKIIDGNIIGRVFDLQKQKIREENEYIHNLIKKSSIFLKKSNLETNKKIIKDIFKEGDILKSVLFLDYMYSTNLSKNKYAIDDIVDFIKSKMFQKLLDNVGENTSIELLNLKFGLSKKRAISFLSKYLYYKTNFNFPIYDSLVIKSSKILFDRKITQKNFYLELNYLKTIYKVNFEDLDGFLWLFGKIQKGSYTTFLRKNDYLKIEKILNNKNQNLNLEKFNEILDVLLDL